MGMGVLLLRNQKDLALLALGIVLGLNSMGARASEFATRFSAQLGDGDLDVSSVQAIDSDLLDTEMLQLMNEAVDEDTRGQAVPAATADVSPASPATTGSDVPKDRAEYCARETGREKFLGQFDANITAFRNDGGLFNGGVCWWHSRLQRSALYLAVFRPELPRPGYDEANELLKKLEANKQVVEIGGYRNWHEFSKDQEVLIQHRLNLWQARDGFLRQAWVRGLMNPAIDRSTGAAENLKKLMQVIATEVEVEKRVTYVKVQLPGITSHAWLILAARPIPTGIDLVLLDSNYLSVTSYSYHYGDTAIHAYDRHGFLPYVEQRGDFKKFEAAKSTYCR